MPSFVRELHRATSAYMKAASGTTAKAIARHTIQIAKSLATDLIGEKRFRGPTMSDFSDADGGGVYLFSNKFSKRLKESLQESNKQFMEEVFALSQEYVPIDKRYAEAKNWKYLSRSVKRDIFDLGEDPISYLTGSREEESFVGFKDRFGDGIKVAKKKALEEEGIQTVSFVRKKGWYEADEYDFIKKMFRGSNRTTALNRVYVGKDGYLMIRKKRTDLSVNSGFKLKNNPYDNNPKRITTKQPSGGYQELKKSGRLTQLGAGYVINYNGYDKTRPSNTFNYAALQHDNTRFKHKYGQSMFLHRAFLHRRRQWYKAIEQSVQDALQNK